MAATDQRAIARRVAGPLWALGTLGIVAGLSTVHATWAGYDLTDSSRFGWGIGFLVVLWFVGYAFGVPGAPMRGRLVTAILVSAAAVLAVSIAQLFVGDALLPRFVVFGTGAVLVPWSVACEALAARGAQGEAVFIVGDVDDLGRLRDDLERSAERPASIVGVCAVDRARARPDEPAPLVSAARHAGATMLVLARDAQDEDAAVTQAAVLHETGMRVRTLLAFSEGWLGKLPVADLERMSVLFDIGEIHGAGYARVKRALDLALAICGVVTMGVVLPMVVLGDVVANRGSLFYRQPRVGRGGREFSILKFRTMRDAGGAPEGSWTSEDDARVTAFGRMLRRTHLDELPQAWNVLRGDLSIVGPRPEQPQYVERLREKIPFYDVRHLVRPGVTGWAQVKYHYGADDADALEKLQYEMWYLRHQSLGVDARVLGRTIRHLAGLRGR